jgi:hypothetical protein
MQPTSNATTQVIPTQPTDAQNQGDQNQDPKKKKHGFWGKLFGKKDNTQPDNQNPPQ